MKSLYATAGSRSEDEWLEADDRDEVSPMMTYARPKKAAPPPIVGLKSRKLIAFGWYGGKFSHLDWLLPLLPAVDLRNPIPRSVMPMPFRVGITTRSTSRTLSIHIVSPAIQQLHS